MLTRLKVNGFKNLVDVDVSFGPFTCVAGVNGVGKSNLFDAITFLGALAEKPLFDAALSVRNEGGRTSDLRSLFFRAGSYQAEEMSFEAEMLIPPSGVDELGQETRAGATFLRYRLTLGLRDSELAIQHEELTPIPWFHGDAGDLFGFAHSLRWQERVLGGRRERPFISMETMQGVSAVSLEDEAGHLGLSYAAHRLPRTVLSRAPSPTAVLVRREMQSWNLLQLDPSALRTPDSLTDPRSIAANGAHLAATLARLAGLDQAEAHASAVYARVANRLAELMEDVRSVRVDTDSRRELLSLILTDRNGTEHEARSLSDGTLRFLALAILESDSEARGVLCLEEPENGIHPQRIPAMLRLLQDLAVDPTIPADEDNPLRQVIVNTHSPAVAAQVPEGSLLVATPRFIQLHGHQGTAPAFRWLPGTWRAQASPDVSPVPLGQVISYLNPLEPTPTGNRKAASSTATTSRGGSPSPSSPRPRDPSHLHPLVRRLLGPGVAAGPALAAPPALLPAVPAPVGGSAGRSEPAEVADRPAAGCRRVVPLRPCAGSQPFATWKGSCRLSSPREPGASAPSK